MDGEAGKSEFLGDGGLQGLAAVINKTYTKTVICKFAVRLALGGRFLGRVSLFWAKRDLRNSLCNTNLLVTSFVIQDGRVAPNDYLRYWSCAPRSLLFLFDALSKSGRVAVANTPAD